MRPPLAQLGGLIRSPTMSGGSMASPSSRSNRISFQAIRVFGFAPFASSNLARSSESRFPVTFGAP